MKLEEETSIGGDESISSDYNLSSISELSILLAQTPEMMSSEREIESILSEYENAYFKNEIELLECENKYFKDKSVYLNEIELELRVHKHLVEFIPEIIEHTTIWRRKRLEVLKTIIKLHEEISKVCVQISLNRMLAYVLDIYFTFVNRDFAISAGLITSLGGLALNGLWAKMCISNCYYQKQKAIVKLLQEDQKLFEPIQEWYCENERIEKAFMKIFPFYFTKTVLKDFSVTISEKKTPSCISNFESMLMRKKYTEDHFPRQNSFLEFKNWLGRLIRSSVIAKLLCDNHESCSRIFLIQCARVIIRRSENFNSSSFGDLYLNGLSLIEEYYFLKNFQASQNIHVGLLSAHLIGELKAMNKMLNMMRNVCAIKL